MSFTRLRYHLVTATKGRSPLITPKIEPTLHELMKEAAANLDSCIVEIGGIEDHVHFVAAVHPNVPVQDFMKRVKRDSSREIKKAIPDASKFQWQAGYGGFTVSPFDLSGIRRYVRRQKEHHANNSLWRRFELLEKLEEFDRAS